MTAPRLTADAVRGLLAMKQHGVFEYERNKNYDSRKGSPIQGHVVRFNPHPKDLGDGRTSHGFNFPALVASDLLGQPEDVMRSVAEQLNAAPDLAADWLRQEARIKALEEAQTWQPIETAPRETGDEFLVWGANWSFPCSASFDGHAFYCPNTGDELSPQPTHWMPLPKPPSAALNPTEGVEG